MAHISKTIKELPGMGFIDYADDGGFSSLIRYFQRYYMIIFIGTSKKKGQSAGKAPREVLTNPISSPGALDILLADKDSGSICADFSRFRNDDVTLQTAIPGRHQSWWGY